MSIFDQLSGELLFTPAPPRDLTAERGQDDELVERTYNGLRAADLDLDQPPQSPAREPS